MQAADCFARNYAQARTLFLGAAEAAALDVHSHLHPLLGRDGEALALDVARFGAASAARLLIISSGCHGIEGYCGSGVQVALLRDPAWHAAAEAAGVAVLYLHALNPYGFSWWRRVTQENVDLNRNFHDFCSPLPRNEAYDEIANLLVPSMWPPSDEVKHRLARYLQTHGPAALQAAVSSGQHDHPEGIYYGGVNPTWSHQTLRHILEEQASRCEQLGWIDLHTGLGPSGHGERIAAADGEVLRLARAWWGDEVTSITEGSSSSAPLTGTIGNAVSTMCPQAEFSGIALEFGTRPLWDVFDALRAEQWLENHPEAPEAQRREIKQQMFDAFFVDSDEWKAQVIEQAFDAAHAALHGLDVH
jgi:Protein of unknown function (DUF2817)